MFLPPYATPTHIPFTLLLCQGQSPLPFLKLSEIFLDENNYSLSRELLIKVEKGHGLAKGEGAAAPAGSFWENSSRGSVWSMGQWRRGALWGQEALEGVGQGCCRA